MTKKKVLSVGHRGARGRAPENTLLSLRKGVSYGVDYIEFDVHLTKDNHLIIMHDKRVNRTTNGWGKIKNKTLKQIKALKTKNKRQEIPTLEEIFKEFKNKTKFMIELKRNAAVKQTVKLIKKYSLEKDSIITSFKAKPLKEIKKELPNIKTALLWTFISRIKHNFTLENKFRFTKRIGCDAIYIDDLYITKRFMREAKKHNLKVYTYLGNTNKKIRKLINYGVDLIESDYPDLLIEVIKKKLKK